MQHNTTLDDYRVKLTGKITNANSDRDILRFINTAMKSLQEKKVNGHIVVRFIDKLSHDFQQAIRKAGEPKMVNNCRNAITSLQKIRNDLTSRV